LTFAQKLTESQEMMMMMMTMMLSVAKYQASWFGGRLAPFYIYQMNRVDSRNGSAMMLAP